MSMLWPEASVVARELSLPEGARLDRLARADVAALIARLDAWCPDLTLSDAALLAPGFYDEAVALRDEESAVARRPVLALVLDLGEGPAACLVLTYEVRGRALLVRLAAVPPASRARGLGVILAKAAVEVGRAMDEVDAVFALTELDDPAAYADFERAGLGLCAILPNAGRRCVGESIRWVPRALLEKPLVAPEDILWPAPEGLLPHSAALLEMLFGRGGEPSPEAAPRPPPLPVLDPATAAALAARPGGRDTWPDIGVLAGVLPRSPGVTVRQLARSDIPWLLSVLPVWYPTLLHSKLSFVLTPEFYEREVALAGEEARVDLRPAFGCLGCVDGEPSLFVLFMFDIFCGRTLRDELAVRDPRQRGKTLTGTTNPLAVLVARALEADTILSWATVVRANVQRGNERAGFSLVGMLPASERDTVAPGVVKHAFEAFYAASLVPEEETFWPPLSAMPERVASLVRFVRGDR